MTCLRPAGALVDFLKPLCLHCGQPLQTRPLSVGLCASCIAALPWNNPACARCAGSSSVCEDGCEALPGVTSICCALRYEPPVSSWIVRAKRPRGYPELKVLGTLLSAAAQESAGPGRPDYLVPVPLARSRFLRRGFNQALLLAQELGRHCGLAVLGSGIERGRATRYQPGLTPADRQANVAGAFRASRRLDGLHVAIVDDVLTSGATATSLAEELAAAGARRIDVWCAARAELA